MNGLKIVKYSTWKLDMRNNFVSEFFEVHICGHGTLKLW